MTEMNSQLLTLALLAAGAYLLGAVPFSVLLGRLFLGKDIRAYGDHNPGAANVFRAGNPLVGAMAVTLDIGKGIPFVVLGQKYAEFPATAVLAIGISAILGHAFSPFLGFKGGKALAVSAGVIIGLLDAGMFFAFFGPALFYALTLESHVWLAILTPLTSVVILMITRDNLVEAGFMLFMAAVFAFKQAGEIRGAPRLKSRLVAWLTPNRPG